MSEKQWAAVDDYINHLFVPADPVLDAALKSASAAGLPPISVSPSQGKLLMLLARICGARKILEIGTLAAYSTIWLARGLAEKGQLVTLEADAKHAAVAKANIARAELNDTVKLILGKAQDTLPKVAADGMGPFDLIFIDADKKSLPEYLTWSIKLSRPGGLIIVDNVIREGNVIDAGSKDPDVQGVRRMNEMIVADSRLCATAIQTVGAKGYDGFAVIRLAD
jgi:predicted O-methyltransferase YrrM